MPSAFRTFKQSDPRFERDGLRHVTVKSPALRQRGDILLFLPEGAAKAGDLPLVILLHGVYGSHWSWALNGGAHRTAARLIAAGEIPPLVLAMPSDGLWGDGSGYVPHAGQDFERWIVDDVPQAAMEATELVSARSPRFIAGLSMGGFGALRLGATYGGRFRGVAGHSSITEAAQMAEFVEERWESGKAGGGDLSVLSAVLTHRESLPPLRFDCGVDDALIGANRELHDALAAAGIAHVYEEFPGGHEWPYWEAHLSDSLRFFAAQL